MNTQAEDDLLWLRMAAAKNRVGEIDVPSVVALLRADAECLKATIHAGKLLARAMREVMWVETPSTTDAERTSHRIKRRIAIGSMTDNPVCTAWLADSDVKQAAMTLVQERDAWRKEANASFRFWFIACLVLSLVTMFGGAWLGHVVGFAQGASRAVP